MKIALISGNRGRWHTSDPNADFRNDHGVETWIHVLGGHFFGSPSEKELPTAAELASFDLIISNSEMRLIPGLAKLSRERRAGQLWVTLIEGAYWEWFDLSGAQAELLRNSDVIGVINRSTTEFFDAIAPGKAHWIGVPVPLDFIESFAKPYPGDREGVLAMMRIYRAPTILAAQGLSEPAVCLVPKLSRTFKNWRKYGSKDRRFFAAKLEKVFPETEFRLEVDQAEFIPELAKFRAAVSLDLRRAWGRNVLEAIAVGTPVVSSGSVEHAQELCPQWMVADELQVEAARSILREILANPARTASELSFAQEKLRERYSPEAAKARLAAALKMDGF
jgi:glycosyltransferase involved in cell wall biosynthesis